MKDAKQAILEKALELGFDAAGVTKAETPEGAAENLARFVAEGRHGEMAWMADKLDKRAGPEALWPQARSVIVLGTNYGPMEVPEVAPDRGRISVYAQGLDYHGVVKKRLKRLGRWMAETYDCRVKVFVDTAPVMEKPLAQAAGLGWQGKHTNLVSREFGSWLFLGEVFTTLELTPDEAQADLCGSCDRCIKACPTGALDEPYRIDAGRCVSYLTIEHKSPIDPALAGAMGGRIFGCDDCLMACPWNKFARPAADQALSPTLEAPLLEELAAMDDVTFRRVFAGTPIKRTGRERMARNARIAIANGPGKDPDGLK